MAAQSSWNAYENFGMGYDELKPQSRIGENTFGGLGATAVDSLDTLWMLGLKQEFGRARAWVADKLSFDKCAFAFSCLAATSLGLSRRLRMQGI